MSSSGVGIGSVGVVKTLSLLGIDWGTVVPTPTVGVANKGPF